MSELDDLIASESAELLACAELLRDQIPSGWEPFAGGRPWFPVDPREPEGLTEPMRFAARIKGPRVGFAGQPPRFRLGYTSCRALREHLERGGVGWGV